MNEQDKKQGKQLTEVEVDNLSGEKKIIIKIMIAKISGKKKRKQGLRRGKECLTKIWKSYRTNRDK